MYLNNDWRVEFYEEAVRDLDRLGTSAERKIIERIEWLGKNFNNITRLPLGGEWQGFFKLRAGDYRVIYEIKRQKHLIIISLIDHRSKVYKRRRRR